MSGAAAIPRDHDASSRGVVGLWPTHPRASGRFIPIRSYPGILLVEDVQVHVTLVITRLDAIEVPEPCPDAAGIPFAHGKRRHTLDLADLALHRGVLMRQLSLKVTMRRAHCDDQYLMSALE